MANPDNTMQTLAVQAAGPMRTEVVMDREFRVMPAVMVREQVLQNNLGRTFLPADVLAESVQSWNGIPVTIGHPMSRGNVPISARTPGVLNSVGVGYVFNARMEADALKADVYFDAARLGAKAPELAQAVMRGEITEVSTGFGTRLRVENGEHGGRAYDYRMEAVVPDHFALLGEQRGACSVSDGCGFGVNAVGESDGGPVVGESHSQQEDTSMAETENATDTGATVEDTVDTTATNCGCTEDVATNDEVDTDEVRPVVDETASEPVAEASADNAMADELATLKSELAALREVAKPLIEEAARERDAVLNGLVANSRVQFSADELGAMTTDALKKLAGSVGTTSSFAGRAPARNQRAEKITHMPVRPYWDTGEVN